MKNLILSKISDIRDRGGFLGLKNIVYPELYPPERRQHVFQDSNEWVEVLVVDANPSMEYKISTYSQDLIKALNNKVASLKKFVLMAAPWLFKGGSTKKCMNIKLE